MRFRWGCCCASPLLPTATDSARPTRIAAPSARTAPSPRLDPRESRSPPGSLRPVLDQASVGATALPRPRKTNTSGLRRTARTRVDATLAPWKFPMLGSRRSACTVPQLHRPCLWIPESAPSTPAWRPTETAIRCPGLRANPTLAPQPPSKPEYRHPSAPRQRCREPPATSGHRRHAGRLAEPKGPEPRMTSNRATRPRIHAERGRRDPRQGSPRAESSPCRPAWRRATPPPECPLPDP